MSLVLVSLVGGPLGGNATDSEWRLLTKDARDSGDWLDVKALFVKNESNVLMFRVEYYGDVSVDGERYVRIYLDIDRDGRWDYWLDPQLWDTKLSRCVAETKNYTIGGNWIQFGCSLSDIGNPPALVVWVTTDQRVSTRIPTGTATDYALTGTSTILVDGVVSDWVDAKPHLSLPNDTRPPYTWFKDFYVTNNVTHLFHRIDLGSIFRPKDSALQYRIYIYYDIDSNPNTGDRDSLGSEYRLQALYWIFPGVWQRGIGRDYALSRYDTSGSEWVIVIDQWAKGEYSDLMAMDAAMEIAVPLSAMGITPGRTITIHYGIPGTQDLETEVIDDIDKVTYFFNSLPDTTPPTVTVSLSATNVSTTDWIEITVVAYDESNGSGIAEVGLYIDDGLVSSWMANGTFGYLLHPNSLGKGSHVCYAVAKDRVENERRTAPVLFAVSEYAPMGTESLGRLLLVLGASVSGILLVAIILVRAHTRMTNRPLGVTAIGAIGGLGGAILTVSGLALVVLRLAGLLTWRTTGYSAGLVFDLLLALSGVLLMFVSWKLTQGKRYAWYLMLAYVCFSIVAALDYFVRVFGSFLLLFSFWAYPSLAVAFYLGGENPTDARVLFLIVVVLLAGYSIAVYYLLRPSVRSYFHKKGSLPKSAQSANEKQP
jgi:hypothetical protein